MMSRLIVKYILKKNFDISNILKYLCKVIKKLEIRNILWLDTLDQNIIHCFQSQTIVESFSPRSIDNQFIKSEVVLPSLNLYHFNDIVVNTCSSNLIPLSGEKIIFERVFSADLQYCNYTTGIIRHHNDHSALFKYAKNKRLIDNALYLGGNGVFNYYHWLIEIVPKLTLITPELLKKYNIRTLILDQSVKDIASFQKTLNLFLSCNSINLNIIYETRKVDLHVKNLFYINNINNIVFNSRSKLSSLSFSCYSPNLIQKTKEIIINGIDSDSSNKDYPKKIFLARSHKSARAYNQQEIQSYLETQGFVAIYLEQLDFDEQVILFRNADFIIGPSGAAWSNIIFCQQNVKAISWLPQHLSEFSVFSTIAHIVNCDLRFIFTEADDKNDIHSNYHIDINSVMKAYIKMS
jgi:capsular polysaccharide biosynthesis protein